MFQYTFTVMFMASVAGFILVCVFILKTIYAQENSKVQKRKKIQDEIEVPYNFCKQICLMKRVAKQISEDRESIENSVLTYHCHFQTRVFKQLEPIQPFIQEILCTSLQRNYSAQNKQVDDFFESLEIIKNDFSTLKIQLQASLSHQNVYERQQDPDSGVPAGILIEVKEDFRKLISENRYKEKEMFQIISEFLGQSQADIHQAMELFSSVVGGNEVLEEEYMKLTLETTLDRVDRMKKNLISAFIFLDRQCSEMEEFQQAVQCFNQKVVHFIITSDKFLKQKKVAGNTICLRLEECESAYAFLTGVIDEKAESLRRQSKICARILARLKNMLTWNDLNLNYIPLPISKQLEACSLEFTDRADWIKNVDVFKEKLDMFLRAVKSNGEQLETLECTFKSFEKSHDLIKSIKRSYNALLRVILSPRESPQKIRYDPRIKLKRGEKAGVNSTEVHDKGNSFRKMVEMKEHISRDKIKWEELDVKFQNVDKETLLFLLKDIMRTACTLAHEEQIMSGGVCEISVQADDYQQWGDFPSEWLLTDVSSEFLIHSSDESTGRASEVTLEA